MEAPEQRKRYSASSLQSLVGEEQIREDDEQCRKAIFLTCSIYDNPGSQVITRSTNYEEVKETVEANVKKGVQPWQANFKITPAEVTLEKYFQLAL